MDMQSRIRQMFQASIDTKQQAMEVLVPFRRKLKSEMTAFCVLVISFYPRYRFICPKTQRGQQW